jgi:hypothetical protein
VVNRLRLATEQTKSPLSQVKRTDSDASVVERGSRRSSTLLLIFLFVFDSFCIPLALLLVSRDVAKSFHVSMFGVKMITACLLFVAPALVLLLNGAFVLHLMLVRDNRDLPSHAVCVPASARRRATCSKHTSGQGGSQLAALPSACGHMCCR